MSLISGFKKIQNNVATFYENKTRELTKLQSNVALSSNRCLLVLKKEIELKHVQFKIRLLLPSFQLKKISNVYTQKLESNSKRIAFDNKKEVNQFVLKEIKIRNELTKLENEKKIESLTNKLQFELDVLTGKSSLDANDKEKFLRLTLLKGKLEMDSDYLISKMNEYGKNALYSHLGPVDFLSILVKSNQNIGILEKLNKGIGNPAGLSETERVALYHYTTIAYSGINEAGRKAKLSGKEIKPPGMLACYQSTISGLEKLPDASAVDKNGNRVQLKRAYYPPLKDPNPEVNKKRLADFKFFCDKNFVKGNIVNDGAFLSTSLKDVPSGQFNAYFEIPADSSVIPGGKLIGFPYSAFSSVDKPDEGEVLFNPLARFEVSKVEGSKVTYKFL
jgi:hypothetical protein